MFASTKVHLEFLLHFASRCLRGVVQSSSLRLSPNFLFIILGTHPRLEFIETLSTGGTRPCVRAIYRKKLDIRGINWFGCGQNMSSVYHGYFRGLCSRQWHWSFNTLQTLLEATISSFPDPWVQQDFMKYSVLFYSDERNSSISLLFFVNKNLILP